MWRWFFRFSPKMLLFWSALLTLVLGSCTFALVNNAYGTEVTFDYVVGSATQHCCGSWFSSRECSIHRVPIQQTLETKVQKT